VSGQKKECEDVDDDDDSLLHDIRLLKQVCQFLRPLVLVHGFVEVPRSFGIIVLSLHAQAHLLSEASLKLFIFCRNPSVYTLRFIW
jgi:hypothetical protein